MKFLIRAARSTHEDTKFEVEAENEEAAETIARGFIQEGLIRSEGKEIILEWSCCGVDDEEIEVESIQEEGDQDVRSET